MGQRRNGESLEFSENLPNVYGKNNNKLREDEDIESWTKDKLSYSEVSQPGWPRPITDNTQLRFYANGLAPEWFFGRGQVRNSRPVDHFPIPVESRTVARTVPGFF
jgi:hypothetical protein